MIAPTPGIVYKFWFKPGYTNFDGTYRLIEIMTYDEYLTQGGDILSDFFTICEKTEEDIQKDLDDLRISKIYKLQVPGDLDTGEIKFAPDIYLGKIPDHNVSKYIDIGFISHIGITEDPEKLAYVIENIQEQFRCALGITPDPKFMSLKEVYLTKEEYKKIEAEREQEAKKIINYFSENIRLQKELSQQKTIIANYEEKIKSLMEDYNQLEEKYEPVQPEPENNVMEEIVEIIDEPLIIKKRRI